MKLFEKYTYRQRKIAVLAIFLLLCVASYKRTFSVTLDLINLREELTQKKHEAENSGVTLKRKQEELIKINNLIGEENVPNDRVQHGFLTFVDNSKTSLIVEEVEEVYRFNHPDFVINTNEITLKGNYRSMVRFLYNFEKNFDLARLVSVQIFVKKNREKKINELFLKVLVQNFSDYE
jgi:hypothetical protein